MVVSARDGVDSHTSMRATSSRLTVQRASKFTLWRASLQAASLEPAPQEKLYDHFQQEFPDLIHRHKRDEQWDVGKEGHEEELQYVIFVQWND